MADGTVLNSGSGGDTIATEDRGLYKTPISLIDVGGRTGAEAIIGDAGVTLPVSLASVPSHAVTNAGTFVVQVNGDALTSLQLLDNAISGAGFNITQFAGAAVPIGAGVEATAVRVTLATDSTGLVSVDDNGGSLTVDAPVGTPMYVRLSDGAAPLTTLPVSLASVPSHEVTNGGTFAVQAASTQTGTWTVQPGNTANTTAWLVTGTGGTFPATQSGTWDIGTVTTVTGVTTVTTCSTVTTLTGSGVAHDGADSGNPHKIGAKATTSISAKTMVANDDRTDLFAGIDGVQITRPHCNLEDLLSGTADITDGSSTSVIAAAGAGVKVYVSDIIIGNSSATAVTVTIRDGAAGAVKATIMVPAGAPVHKTLQCPIAFSANTAVCADPSAAASTVSVTLSGFKSKV